MTSSPLLAASALITLLLAGCASPTDTGSTAGSTPPPTERIYRTGSNIPVKDPKPLTPEERERQAEAARAALSNGAK